MQKQKKKLKKKNKKILKTRVRKILLNYNIIFNYNLIKFMKKTPKYIINLKIKQNNIFCTLNNLKNKTIAVFSSGINKVKITKKLLRFGSKIMIPQLLYRISKKIKKKKTLFTIIAPKIIRKRLLFTIKKIMKKNTLLLNIQYKKCFNGCKEKKQKRKKQKGFKVLK